MMKISNIDARRRIAGISAGLLAGGLAMGISGGAIGGRSTGLQPRGCKHHRFLGDRRGAAISCRAS